MRKPTGFTRTPSRCTHERRTSCAPSCTKWCLRTANVRSLPSRFLGRSRYGVLSMADRQTNPGIPIFHPVALGRLETSAFFMIQFVRLDGLESTGPVPLWLQSGFGLATTDSSSTRNRQAERTQGHAAAGNRNNSTPMHVMATLAGFPVDSQLWKSARTSGRHFARAPSLRCEAHLHVNADR